MPVSRTGTPGASRGATAIQSRPGRASGPALVAIALAARLCCDCLVGALTQRDDSLPNAEKTALPAEAPRVGRHMAVLIEMDTKSLRPCKPLMMGLPSVPVVS